MTVKEKIQEDFKKALKERKEIEVSVLRMLKTAILNKEKEKRYNLSKEKPELKPEDLEKESQLTDEELVQATQSEIKKRKEAILCYEKGQRFDLAEKEKKEIGVLQRYLPEQLSENEIEKIAREAIKKVGAKELKDMGKVMSGLMSELKGRADGSLASKIVRELLTRKK